MSSESQQPVQTSSGPIIVQETHGVNSPVPPISSLATHCNIPPIMAWHSYAGLNNPATPQPVGVSVLEGLPRASQVVPRNYQTSYHSSSPVYSGETPIRHALDAPTIRQALEAPVRNAMEHAVRETPTIQSNSVTLIDPTVHIDSSIHATVHSLANVAAQEERLATSLPTDTSNIIAAALEASKLEPVEHHIIPTTISERTDHQISIVHNLPVLNMHHIPNAQETLLHTDQSVAAYSVVTHTQAIDTHAPHMSHHTALAPVPASTPTTTSVQHYSSEAATAASAKGFKTSNGADEGSPLRKRSRSSLVNKCAKRTNPSRSTTRTLKGSPQCSLDTLESFNANQGVSEEKLDLGDVLKHVPLHTSKNSARKLKRKAYSIKDKLKTVERVHSGESRSKILRDMGIPDSTLRGWMKDEEKLRTFAFNVDVKKKKARTAKDTLLDSVLYSWYLQQKDRGMAVSGSMLKVKADELNKDINGENNFKASAGWLYRFQKRHNLGKQKDPNEEEAAAAKVTTSEHGYREEILHFPYDQMHRKNEDTSVDEKVIRFCQKLKEMIASGGYTDEHVYTCDETGFFYKLLPDNNFLVPSDEPSCTSSKRIRDRVTVLFCVNKTGQHKLKPLCVGKYRSPRGFQHVNVSKLPFWYKCSQNAWMTPVIFKDWFYSYFIPEVKQHMQEKKLEEKAILLLDENPAHPSGQVLTTEDGNFHVLFLPKDTLSVVQPLDDGIMATFKSNYRGELMKQMASAETDMKLYLRHLSLKRMMFIGEKAWSSVDPKVIERLWYKCLPTAFDQASGIPDAADGESEVSAREKADLERLFQERLEGAGIETSLSTIREWSNLNENLPVTDIATGENAPNDQNQSSEPLEQEPSDEEDDNQSKVPSNAEAVKAFEVGLQWLESKNIDYITILQVQSILDYARYERRNELSQLNNS